MMKPCPSSLLRCATLCAALLLMAAPLAAADTAAAETTAKKLVPRQEQAGYEFRAELWANELASETGRAVRLQLFKGHEYAFCIAVPEKSGVVITAAVLDFEGRPGGELLPVKDGWGLVLFYKPKKTGQYVVAVRQTEAGKKKPTPCAIATGWK